MISRRAAVVLRDLFCRIFCSDCLEHPQPVPIPEWRIGAGDITVNLKGVFEMNVKANIIAIALSVAWLWTDKDGNTHPAKVQGDTTITCDRPDLFTLEQDPTSKQWNAKPVAADQLPASDDNGVYGTATFTATADADLGEGVDTVSAVGALTLIQPDANTGSINFTPQ